MFCLETMSCVILGDKTYVLFDCVCSRGRKCATPSITATYTTVTRLTARTGIVGHRTYMYSPLQSYLIIYLLL
jgi:hypothetical protein